MTNSTSTFDFTGVGVAVVTPMIDHQIAFGQLKQVVKHVSAGVKYIVALGSTGEAATISEIEQRQVLDTVIHEADIPVVAGNFGGNDTHALVQKLKHYNFDGISAILSSSPHYNKPTQEGIYQHYMILADNSPVPIILYNVPGRTSSNMEASTTLRLAQHENIIGIKEASNQLDQIKEIIENCGDDFWLTSGDDVLAPRICELGGIGVISVVANAYPKAFSQQIEAVLQGRKDEADAIEKQLAEIHPLLYTEGNPTGVKCLMNLLDICSDQVRLPLLAGSTDLINQFKPLL